VLRRSALLCCVTLGTAPVVAAQVSISPRTVEPADLVRFAIQVANPSDTPVVTVRVEVPEALAILGVDAPAGWTRQQVAATDTTPQAIEWSGGQLGRREFQEFEFFARLDANARRTALVFPVRITRADGTAREWRAGGFGQAPEVEIHGTVGITAGAAFTLAAAALGLAALGVALALRRPLPR
jgi:uncharacterized protein YcnI